MLIVSDQVRQKMAVVAYFLAAFLSVSCRLSEKPLETRDQIKAPEKWMSDVKVGAVTEGWLREMGSSELLLFVERAMAGNLELKQMAYSVEESRQELISTGAELWPQLDLRAQQRDEGTLESGSNNKTASLSLDLNYELDIWGKLSAVEQAANLKLLERQAAYEQSRQYLVVDVIQGWLNVIESQKLLELYKKRVENVEENQRVIEASYKRGLNNALDVYLVRNELHTEKARVSHQETLVKESLRRLERYFGDYPSGQLAVKDELPELKTSIKAGLPKDLITRKPALAASWNKLLAQNATLAFAHRQRLPSLTFSASLQEGGKQLNNMFTGAPTVWSLMGGVMMPLFRAGELKANEEAERFTLKRLELDYLTQVYEAYMLVENAITQEIKLKEQYRLRQQAKENAVNSASLSFDQYQKGLVDYTTVLESQKRSYGAQEAMIQVRAQLVSNRAQLHLALGGKGIVSE